MRSWSLADLAASLSGKLNGDGVSSLRCSSVSVSSQSVTHGNLFVAIRGSRADGHRFIEQAFSRGASAAVVEDPESLHGRPGIVVSDTRAALSRLAALLFGEPAKKLTTVGITGTNGKTTTNWIVYHTLNGLGKGCQRIGTLGSECMWSHTRTGTLTSPDALSIHELLAAAVAHGAGSSVLEVSSHALDQARMDDLEFDVGVFTNLTRDHLDYHQTMERYFEAKRRLFTLLASSSKATRAAVINHDDEYGRRLIGELPTWGLHNWSFGRSPDATLYLEVVTETPEGLVLRIRDRVAGVTLVVESPFIGGHNAENVLAAFGVCRALGYAPDVVASALAGVPQVPGRLERVGEAGPRVFVDYAHTPDALRRVVDALRPTTHGKLWIVFGCGGDRDKGKRPEMGRVASAGGDCVVVTSDNPRTEEPQVIISDIVVGVPNPELIEVDRRKAIEHAIHRAAANDTVLIAGKGHEDYQIIGSQRLFFSDQAVAAESLRTRKSP